MRFIDDESIVCDASVDFLATKSVKNLLKVCRQEESGYEKMWKRDLEGRGWMRKHYGPMVDESN